MPFYTLRLRPDRGWGSRGWSGQHRDVALAWLDRHYCAGDPVTLRVYAEGIDELPTLAITDPARVFEYLSGGRRCGLPVSSVRPLPVGFAWCYWALLGLGSRLRRRRRVDVVRPPEGID